MALKRKSQSAQAGPSSKRPALKQQQQQQAPKQAKRPIVEEDDEDFISDDGADVALLAATGGAGGASSDSGDSDGESAADDERRTSAFVDDEASESDGDGGASSDGAEDGFVVPDHESVSGSEDEEAASDDGEADRDDAEQAAAAPKEYNQKKGSSLYHPPTNEEMQALKSATTLYKSPLFSLLLQSLLPSLRPLAPSTHPAPAPLAALLKTLQALRPFVLALKALPPTTPRLTTATADHLPYPGQGPADDSKWLMAFAPPTECQITGAWPLETLSSRRPSSSKKGKGKGSDAGREGEVELALAMPDAFFQDKDFLNGRWAHKRVYWLGVVGKALREHAGELGLGEVAWRVEEGAEWTPRLVVRSRTDGKANDFSKLALSIVLTPVVPAALFPSSKLSPLRNALRPPPTESAAAPPPTPKYNAALLSASLAPARLLYLHALSGALPAFKDASLLLQLWGAKRGLGSAVPFGTPSTGWRDAGELILGFLVFGGEVLPRASAAAGAKAPSAAGKKIGKGMSSYQVFRAVLDFLSHAPFASSAVFLGRQPKAPSSPIAPIAKADFVASASEAILVGPEGTVNALLGVEHGVLALVAREAKGTLDLLDADAGADGEGEAVFERVFLRGGEGAQEKFDAVFRIDLSTAQHQFKAPLDRLDEPSRLSHLLAAMSAVLRRALGTRAKLVVLRRSSPATATTTWPVGSARPDASDESQIVELGLTLDQAECWRLVDAGPSAEDEAGSEDFRQFWGDKSELRRFKDGRIIESVVWDIGQEEGERALIVGRSVRYILGRHFGLGLDAISTESAAGYLPLMRLPESARDLLAVEGAPADGFRPALDAYTALVATLRSLEDQLPLSLLNVFPVAQGLRYTSVSSPLPVDADRLGLAPDCLKYVEPLDVVVQFESSGKWPDDLTAIQKIKLAFLHKMAGLLAQAVEGARVAVAVDDCDDADEAVIRDNCALEVFHPSGFAFRLRIHHDRERTLLQQLAADKKTAKPRTRRAAQKALDLHNHRFSALPRHHAAINSIHHLYPSFSLTARLVQRWFAAHMLSAHVSAELVELLCASVYLVPTPHQPPASPSAGFARVMALLARWKWATVPLVLPLYSTAGADAGTKVAFPADKRALALAAFKKLRETDARISAGAFFVATEEDLTGRVFGAAQPSRLVAARVGQIAKATLAYLEQASKDGSLVVEQLFKTPLEDYSFLIHLVPAVLPRAYQAVTPDLSAWQSKYRNASSLKAASAAYGSELRVDFDPVAMYLREIERAFGDAFVLFHDARGGAVICGIWNPAQQQPRNYKVQLPFSTKPAAVDGGDARSQMVVLNEAGLIAELRRLGEGLVDRIEVRS